MSNESAGIFPPFFSLARKASASLNRLFLLPPRAQRPICSVARNESIVPSECLPRERFPHINIPLNLVQKFLRVFVPAAHAKTIQTIDQDTAQSLLKDLFGPPLPGNDKPFITIYPAAKRIVAIGDIHGDVDAFRKALQNSGVIDSKDRWIGGPTVLVQVGDQLDRGNQERAVYDLLFNLQDRAPLFGGAVHILLGNHELMNSRLDFRYVSRGGFDDFHQDGGIKTVFGQKVKPRTSVSANKTIQFLPEKMRARARSVVAGGPLAMELSQRARLSLIVGDNLFVHGGLSPKHLRFGGYEENQGLDAFHQLNLAVRNYLQGRNQFPSILLGGSSPVWMRAYSRPKLSKSSPECRMLDETLKRLGVKRMIVGHTPQAGGINSACCGKVWRVDTGMCSSYGGVPEAIDIDRRGNVKIYSPLGTLQGSARSQ